LRAAGGRLRLKQTLRRGPESQEIPDPFVSFVHAEPISVFTADYSKFWFNTPSNLRFALAPAQVTQRLQNFAKIF
jgi:hypothetical protein